MGGVEKIGEFVQAGEGQELGHQADGLRAPRLQELRPARQAHARDLPRGARRARPARRSDLQAGDVAREDRPRGRVLRRPQALSERRLLFRHRPARDRHPGDAVHRDLRARPNGRLDRAAQRDDRRPGVQDRPAAPALHRRDPARSQADRVSAAEAGFFSANGLDRPGPIGQTCRTFSSNRSPRGDARRSREGRANLRIAIPIDLSGGFPCRYVVPPLRSFSSPRPPPPMPSSSSTRASTTSRRSRAAAGSSPTRALRRVGRPVGSRATRRSSPRRRARRRPTSPPTTTTPPPGGTLANWLISPTFSTQDAGGTVSFYVRADIVPGVQPTSSRGASATAARASPTSPSGRTAHHRRRLDAGSGQLRRPGRRLDRPLRDRLHRPCRPRQLRRRRHVRRARFRSPRPGRSCSPASPVWAC